MAMKLIERVLEVTHIRRRRHTHRITRGTRLLYIRIKRRKRRGRGVARIITQSAPPPKLSWSTEEVRRP